MDTVTYAGVMLGLLLGAAYYVLIHRPKAVAAARQAATLNAITGGEVVLTKGGVFGTVLDADGGVIELQVSSKTTLRIDRGSIQAIIAPEDDRWATVMKMTAEDDQSMGLAAAQ